MKMVVVVVRSTTFYEVWWCLLAYLPKYNVLLKIKECVPLKHNSIGVFDLHKKISASKKPRKKR